MGSMIDDKDLRKLLEEIYYKDFEKDIKDPNYKVKEVDDVCRKVFEQIRKKLPSSGKGYESSELYRYEKNNATNLIESLKHFIFLYRTLCVGVGLVRISDYEVSDSFSDIFLTYETLLEWHKEMTMRFVHLQNGLNSMELLSDKPTDKEILDLAEIEDHEYIRKFLIEYVELRYNLEGYIIKLQVIYSHYLTRVTSLYGYFYDGHTKTAANDYDKVTDEILNRLQFYTDYLKEKEFLPQSWTYNFSNLDFSKDIFREYCSEDEGKYHVLKSYFSLKYLQQKETTSGLSQESADDTVKKNNLREIRVFISSTFSDMQAERDELVKTFNMLRQQAEKRGISIVMIDLRWGITLQESERGEVVDICLTEIGKSKPFFIGILGENYGSVPPDSLLVNKELLDKYPWLSEDINNGLSYTEIEMQSAVLRNKDNLNAYFFIKDGCGNDDAKLQRLKSEIEKQKRYPVYKYKDPQDLADEVYNYFTEYLDDLIDFEEVTLGERKQILQDSRLNQLAEAYLERPLLEEAIEKFLKDSIKKILMIEGSEGSGKSSLAARIASKYTEQYKIKLYFDDANGSSSDLIDLLQFMLEIPVSYDNLIQLIRLMSEDNQDPTLVIIDDVDKIKLDKIKDELNLWVGVIPENVKVIITSAPESELKQLIGKHSALSNITIGNLGEDEKKDLIMRFLKKRGKKLTDTQIEGILKTPLSGNASMLTAILQELAAFGYFERLNEKILGISRLRIDKEFYMQTFMRLENNFGHDPMKKLCGYLSVSSNGLMEKDLLELCNLRRLDLSLLLGNGEAIFNSREGMVRFNSARIRQLAYNRYVGKELVEIELRENLVEYCTKMCETFSLTFANYDPGKKDFSYDETAWYVHELAYQLLQLNDFVKMTDFIENPGYFEAIYRLDWNLLNKLWQSLETGGYNFESLFESLKNYNLEHHLLPVVLNDIGRLARENKANDIAAKANELAISSMGSFDGESIYIQQAKWALKTNEAIAAYKADDFEKALSLFTIAKSMAMDLFPELSKERVKASENLGTILQEMKRYDEAIKYLKEALDLSNRLYKTDHNTTSVDIMMKWGECLLSLDNYEEALIIFSSVADISFEMEGEISKDGYKARLKIGYCYKYMGKLNEAIEVFTEVAEKCYDIFGKDFWITKSAYSNLGQIWEHVAQKLKDSISKDRYLEYLQYAATGYANGGRPEKAQEIIDLYNSLI